MPCPRRRGPARLAPEILEADLAHGRAARPRVRGRAVGLGPVRPQDRARLLHRLHAPLAVHAHAVRRRGAGRPRARGGSGLSPRAPRSSSRARSGGFVSAAAETRRPLFVAEEIGIVPIRSILADLRSVETTGPPRWSTRRVTRPGSCTTPSCARCARRPPRLRVSSQRVDASRDWQRSVDRLVTDVTGLVAYVAGGEATIDASPRGADGQGAGAQGGEVGEVLVSEEGRP